MIRLPFLSLGEDGRRIRCRPPEGLKWRTSCPRSNPQVAFPPSLARSLPARRRHRQKLRSWQRRFCLRTRSRDRARSSDRWFIQRRHLDYAACGNPDDAGYLHAAICSETAHVRGKRLHIFPVMDQPPDGRAKHRAGRLEVSEIRPARNRLGAVFPLDKDQWAIRHWLPQSPIGKPYISKPPRIGIRRRPAT